MRSKMMWAVVALVVVLGITTAASATTRGWITGTQIAPHTINSKHLANHTIQKHDLSTQLVRSLHDASDPSSNGFDDWYCAAGTYNGCYETPVTIDQSTPEAAPFFLTMDLPAGSFIVTAEVMVVATSETDPPDWRVTCEIHTPLGHYGSVGFASATVGDAAGDSREATIPIVFGARQTVDGEAGLHCWRSAGSGATGTGANPTVAYAEMTAVQVATMHLG